MQRFQQTLQPITDLLDEGLRIYRRRFGVFLLLTAIWIVPVAVGSGLSIAIDESLGLLFNLLLALPLAIYLMGALSQAALRAQQDQPIRLREVLAVSPWRLIGMGSYAFFFALFVAVLTAMTIGACWCLALSFISFSFGASAAMSINGGPAGEVLSFMVGTIMLFVFVLLYLFSLVLAGSTYSSLVYSLQPFVQHQLRLREAVRRSFDLLGYRIGFNVLVFLLTSSIFGAIMLAVTIAIGTLLPLPLLLLLGEESPLAQGISTFAWLLGLTVVLPPVPIWMALLYQRNHAARAGDDLEARIAAILLDA